MVLLDNSSNAEGQMIIPVLQSGKFRVERVNELSGSSGQQMVRTGLPSQSISHISVIFFLTFYFVLEYNGTPLQYCCLENPMDGGAW